MARDRWPALNPALIVRVAVGAVTGYTVAEYAGLMALVPIVGALLLGLLFVRVVDPATRPMLPAFIIQAGQFFWFLVGALATGHASAVLLDVILLAVGLTWLIIRTGLVPVILLLLYQSVSLGLNITMFTFAPAGSGQRTTLLVHLILRAAAIMLLIVGMQLCRGAADQDDDEPTADWDWDDQEEDESSPPQPEAIPEIDRHIETPSEPSPAPVQPVDLEDEDALEDDGEGRDPDQASGPT